MRMDDKEPKESGLERLQRLLAIAGSISALLIAAGYFVINGSFALRQLRLPLYAVSLSQYISAGIYFSIEMVVTTALGTLTTFYVVQIFFHGDRTLNVVDNYLPGLWKWAVVVGGLGIVSAANGIFVQTLAFFVIYTLVVTVFAFVHVKYAKRVQGFWDAHHIRFPAVGRLVKDVRQWVTSRFSGWQKYVAVTFPAALLYSAFVCITNYTNVSPVIGGGKPECVNLIFKDDSSVNALDFTPHPNGVKHRTDRVEVMAITNEGYLVFDAGKGRAISVKSDLLNGFVGCDPLPGYPTPTALPVSPTSIATATSTPNTIATLAATPTP